MVYEEYSAAGRTDQSLSIKLEAGPSGAVIFEGYRTLDGKNFYHDDSLPRLNHGASHSAMFNVGGGGNSESIAITSYSGTGNGFVGGKESFSFSFGGGKEGKEGKENADFSIDVSKGSASFGGAPLKGSNPLTFIFANLI